MKNKRFRFSADGIANAVAPGAVMEANGRKYRATRKKAYLHGMAVPSWPVVDDSGRFFTRKTLANSVESLQHMHLDYRHLSEGYLAPEVEIDDEHGQRIKVPVETIIGSVADAWQNPRGDGTDGEDTHVVVAVEKKPFTIRTLQKIAAGEEWGFSYELEPETDNEAYENETFRPLTEEENTLIADSANGSMKDHPTGALLAMGGEDGSVVFEGLALTPTPAYDETTVLRMAAESITRGKSDDRAKPATGAGSSKKGTRSRRRTFSFAEGGEKTVKTEIQKLIEMLTRCGEMLGDEAAEDLRTAMAESGSAAKALLSMAEKADADGALERMIAEGELVRKADHETAVENAKKSAAEGAEKTVREQFEAEQKEKERVAGVKAERAKALAEAGITLAEDPTKDGAAHKVIRKAVDAIGFAAEDEETFKTALAEEWKPLVEETKKGKASAEGAGGGADPAASTTGDDGGGEDEATLADLRF